MHNKPNKRPKNPQGWAYETRDDVVGVCTCSHTRRSVERISFLTATQCSRGCYVKISVTLSASLSLSLSVMKLFSLHSTFSDVSVQCLCWRSPTTLGLMIIGVVCFVCWLRDLRCNFNAGLSKDATSQTCKQAMIRD